MCVCVCVHRAYNRMHVDFSQISFINRTMKIQCIHSVYLGYERMCLPMCGTRRSHRLVQLRWVHFSGLNVRWWKADPVTAHWTQLYLRAAERWNRVHAHLHEARRFSLNFNWLKLMWRFMCTLTVFYSVLFPRATKRLFASSKIRIQPAYPFYNASVSVIFDMTHTVPGCATTTAGRSYWTPGQMVKLWVAPCFVSAIIHQSHMKNARQQLW